MIAENAKKQLNPRAQLKKDRRTMLNGMSFGELTAYVMWRYRVFLLASGYPLIAAAVLAWHYR